MADLPFAFDIPLPSGVPSRYDHHIVRTLSSMKGQYADARAYEAMLARGDDVIYEVYELHRPEAAGDLTHGVTIIHPGQVGDEYSMTKGHFHAVLDTAEVYYGLAGAGLMVMETPEGECSVELIKPGRAVFVPPRWAHRTVNTGGEDLIFLWVYPAHAGHNYGTIEQQGFRKRVIEREGRPLVVDQRRKETPTFYFIGVTTGQSKIMQVFPAWMQALGRADVAIEGIDLKIHDDPARYRQAVAQIKFDPLSLGALVTTHKIDLLDAARDLFDYLDPYAQLCGEVSSISKRGGALEGHAKDPISSGLSLDAVVGDGYFGRTGGDVLCFGAGGSGVAIALHLINKPRAGDRPRRFVVVNRSPGRLDHLRRMVEGLDTDIVFEYVCNQDPRKNDALMAGMPEDSVVINATGMGKDSPGSPITADGLFPLHSVAWELNYRGELDFLRQAQAQSDLRHLRVADGWLYFLHGWTQVIAQVFHIPLDGATFEQLASIAQRARA